MPGDAGMGSVREGSCDEQGSRIVKLKGLPYRVLKSEIVQFFEGIPVVYVHFVYEADGRLSGLVRNEKRSEHDGLCHMCSPQQLNAARFGISQLCAWPRTALSAIAW